jgi:hypothetical protein
MRTSFILVEEAQKYIPVSNLQETSPGLNLEKVDEYAKT